LTPHIYRFLHCNSFHFHTNDILGLLALFHILLLNSQMKKNTFLFVGIENWIIFIFKRHSALNSQWKELIWNELHTSSHLKNSSPGKIESGNSDPSNRRNLLLLKYLCFQWALTKLHWQTMLWLTLMMKNWVEAVWGYWNREISLVVMWEKKMNLASLWVDLKTSAWAKWKMMERKQ